MSETILEAAGLTKHFFVGHSLFSRGTRVRAVDDVSLKVRRGETFAIVGESGSGKSTLARLLALLIQPTAGGVMFEGREVTELRGAALTAFRSEVQFVFQDPFSSLNPRMSVGRLVAEPLETHQSELDGDARREEVVRLLVEVGLRAEHANRFPHEFSGGQRQRIGIARALASRPKLLIADEPVSALDVSVQAQVINLLSDLKQTLGLTLVIIAHDLAVIRQMSDHVAVMYLGEIVESGPAEPVFGEARHPYTRALLSAIPEPAPQRGRIRVALSGEMPSPSAPPPGCRFHTRCPHRRPDCAVRVPEREGSTHTVACHYWRQIATEAEPVGPAEQPAPRPEVARRMALYRQAMQNGEHKTRRETT